MFNKKLGVCMGSLHGIGKILKPTTATRDKRAIMHDNYGGAAVIGVAANIESSRSRDETYR